MSRDWEEEPRRRSRRRYDELDIRRRTPQLSTGVTAAGVFTIVLGSLSLLCFLCTGLVGGFVSFIGEVARQQGNLLPGFFAATGTVLLGLSVLYLLLGIGYLIAGIVTLQRRNWGRVFTLVMGGISLLLGIAQVVFAVLDFMGVAIFMPAQSEHEQVVNGCLNLVAALLYFGHGILVFATLLNSYNIAEFD